MIKFFTVILFLSSVNAFADLQSCKNAVKEGIESCQKSGTSAYAADEAAGAQLQAQSGINMRSGAENLNAAANDNATRWSAVKVSCVAERRQCADKCNAVNESPQAKHQAEEEKTNCFGKVNQVIQQAERGITSNTVATSESAATGNVSGRQGAETIEGNIHKVGSGPQGIAFTQGGETKIYYSSNTPGTGNLESNMRYLQGLSDPGTTVRLIMPGK